MIKEREANSWKSVSYAKSISGAQTYTKFPIVLRTTEQSIPTWSVKGNMVQSGTPTPTSPITPSECGERTENLFDVSTIRDNGYYDNTGTWQNNNNFAASALIPVDSSLQYTIKTTWSPPKEDKFAVTEWDTNGNFLRRTNNFIPPSDRIITFTVGSDCKSIRLQLAKSGDDISYTMLNVGSTAKPYEPYGYKLPIVSGNTTTNIYLSEPLRKINTYYDQLSHTGFLLRNIKKIVFDGTEPSWTKSVRDDPTSYLYHINITTINYGVGETEEIMCTHEPYSTDYPGGNTQGCTFKKYQDEYKIFYINLGSDIMNAQTSGNTVEGLKEYLAQQYSAGTPVTFWYVLSIPLPQSATTSAIPTTAGLNTIDVATTLKPSEMSLTYDGYKLCKRQRYSRTEQLLDKDNIVDGGAFYPSVTGDRMIASNNTAILLLPCKPNTTYTISRRNVITKRFVMCFLTSNEIYVDMPIYGDVGDDTGLTLTSTSTAESKYLCFYYGKTGGSDSSTPEEIQTQLAEVMINEGSTAKPYQPYLDWE